MENTDSGQILPNKKTTDNDSENDSDMEDMDPTLQNVIDQESLKWIFVGGKGGVGKTTTSCSLAVMLASKREKVLIISTDPAHNLSDAFGQQFGPQETLVHGFNNLYAMEIDPKINFQDYTEGVLVDNKTRNVLMELSNSMPGIDEAMSFAELMKQVEKSQYTVIVFDTAPTGHTLRLLAFPTVIEKALGTLDKLKSKFGGLLQNVSSLLQNNMAGSGAGGNGLDVNAMNDKIEEVKGKVEKIKNTFQDDNLTTFIAVCIPEFLSLYETERLVQKLAKFGIDTHNIVINQILFPEKDGNCKRCAARVKMQARYIQQFHDLYPDFHLVKMPLMSDEVRHVEKLRRFAYLLLHAYSEMTEEEREEKIDFGPEEITSAATKENTNVAMKTHENQKDHKSSQNHHKGDGDSNPTQDIVDVD